MSDGPGTPIPDEELLIGAGELSVLLAEDKTVAVIDLRDEEEFRMLHLDGARPATRELVDEMFDKWPKDARVVVCDHFGDRAINAARVLAKRGFSRAKALKGGIDAWSLEVDPLVPRYP